MDFLEFTEWNILYYRIFWQQLMKLNFVILDHFTWNVRDIKFSLFSDLLFPLWNSYLLVVISRVFTQIQFPKFEKSECREMSPIRTSKQNPLNPISPGLFVSFWAWGGTKCPPPPARSRKVLTLLWWNLARLQHAISSTVWAYDVSVMTWHDDTMTSQTS